MAQLTLKNLTSVLSITKGCEVRGRFLTACNRHQGEESCVGVFTSQPWQHECLAMLVRVLNCLHVFLHPSTSKQLRLITAAADCMTMKLAGHQ